MMWWDVVIETITVMSNAIYAQGDQAIQNVCMLAWGQIFGYVAGLMIGFALIKSLFDDELIQSFQRLGQTILPLIIIAYFIQPAAGGCRVVAVKNDAMALGAAATGIVAPTFAGDAGALSRTAARRASEIMGEFTNDLLRASFRDDTTAQQRRQQQQPADMPTNP